jgi:hypothetical protein
MAALGLKTRGILIAHAPPRWKYLFLENHDHTATAS